MLRNESRGGLNVDCGRTSVYRHNHQSPLYHSDRNEKFDPAGELNPRSSAIAADALTTGLPSWAKTTVQIL